MVESILNGVFAQFKSLRKILVLLYAPIAALFLGVGVLGNTVDDISQAALLRDIVATAGLPFYTGFVTQLAGMLWSAATTVCFLSWLLLTRRSGDYNGIRRLFLQGGILTFVLLLDDVFLFHEEVFPKYLHINERLPILGYLVLGIAFVVSNWRMIQTSEYLILIVALMLFGFSIALDALPIQDLNVRYFWEKLRMLLEDGSKFAGIASWLAYFVRIAMQFLGVSHD